MQTIPALEGDGGAGDQGKPQMPGSTGGQGPVPYPALRDWLLFGFLIHWMTTAAIGPLAVKTRDAQAMQVSVFWFLFRPVITVVTATVSYLALRWWTFALERRSWRSTLLLPMLVLAGTGFATVFGVLGAFAFFGASLKMSGEGTSSPATGLVASGMNIFVPIATLYIIPVAAVGFGLWRSERLAARLIGGMAQSQGWRLLWAHIAGAAALGITPFAMSDVLMIPAEGANALPNTPALNDLGWLALAQIAVLPHLWLTWRAWRQPGAEQAAPRAALVPFEATLIILYALGAAWRVDIGLDGGTALAWAADYLSYLAYLVAEVFG